MKQAVYNTLDAIGEPINRAMDAADAYIDKDPEKAGGVYAGVAIGLSVLAVGAEVTAQVLKKDTSFAGSVGRNALHGVATASTLATGLFIYVTGHAHGEAYAEKH